MIRDRLVAHHPQLVEGLDRRHVEALAGALASRSFTEGDVLLEHGRPAETLFLVPEGAVAISMGAAAHELLLGEPSAATLVGDVGLLDPGPSTATVRARRDFEALALSRSGLLALLDANPAAAGRLLWRMAQGLALRLRESSAISMQRDEAGNGYVRSLIAPLADVYGRIPTNQGASALLGASLGEAGDAADQSRLVSLLQGERELVDCPPAYLAAIAKSMEIRRVPAGTMLVEQGTTLDGAYFLMDGLVRVEALHAGASFHVDRRMGGGSLLGLVSFLLDGRRTATVLVEEDATVALIYASVVTYLLDGAAAGAPAPARFLHWVAAQLAEDARALNEAILAAWTKSV